MLRPAPLRARRNLQGARIVRASPATALAHRSRLRVVFRVGAASGGTRAATGRRGRDRDDSHPQRRVGRGPRRTPLGGVGPLPPDRCARDGESDGPRARGRRAGSARGRGAQAAARRPARGHRRDPRAPAPGRARRAPARAPRAGSSCRGIRLRARPREVRHGGLRPRARLVLRHAMARPEEAKAPAPPLASRSTPRAGSAGSRAATTATSAPSARRGSSRSRRSG